MRRLIATTGPEPKPTARPVLVTPLQPKKRLPTSYIIGFSACFGIVSSSMATGAFASVDLAPGFSVDPIAASLDGSPGKRVPVPEKLARPVALPATATPAGSIQAAAAFTVTPASLSAPFLAQADGFTASASQSSPTAPMLISAIATRTLPDPPTQLVAAGVVPAQPSAAPLGRSEADSVHAFMPAPIGTVSTVPTGETRVTMAERPAGVIADANSLHSATRDVPSGEVLAAPAPLALVRPAGQVPLPAASEPEASKLPAAQSDPVSAPKLVPITQAPDSSDEPKFPPKSALVGPSFAAKTGPDVEKPVPEIDRTPPDKSGDVRATPANLGVESLRDAIVAALRENPDIQIALARQDDARYGVHQANAGYMPKLDVTLGVGPEVNRPATGSFTRLRRTEGTASLNQTIWDFGVTINDIKRARADYRSAQWATREQIEAIAYEITSAYLNVLQAQKLVELSQEEVAAHQKLLKMVTIQNELGLNTSADVSRAKSRLENIRSVQLDRESLLQQAREGYRRLTNRLPGRAIDIPSAGPALPSTQDAAVDLIDKRSPRMAQAMEDRRSLDRQQASQTGAFFPRIGLQAQTNWKDDVQGNTGFNRDGRVMLTLSYSFSGGAEMAIRKRIGARLREADYEVDRRHREVEQDVRIDFTALDAARSKITTIDSEIDAAERVQQLYVQQFREGRRTVFDLLDSQQSLFSARANRLTNMTAKQLAEFRVLQKLGSLFELVSDGQPLPNLVVPAPVRTRK